MGEEFDVIGFTVKQGRPMKPTRPRKVIWVSPERITALEAENERLRGLLQRFVADDFLHSPSQPYAIVPYSDDLECRFCEESWELSGTEHHADDCPVVLARAELEQKGARDD